MFQFIPTPIKGVVNYTLLGVNTVALSTPLLALSCFKLLPFESIQKTCTRILIRIAEKWVSNNSKLIDLTHQTTYHISGTEDLHYDGWYMVISNHQSWADILVLQKVFNHKIPFLKFFLKKELIWVPVIGLCWWALDFPFMQRFTKEFLTKHPELTGKDLEITRKACEKFQYTPVSVMNFLEGTRFTTIKHDRQRSPFKHLLKPKSGGIAYALNIMDEQINTLVDVTIYYPDFPKGSLSFWDFISGKAKSVTVDVRIRHIPEEMKKGDYENDPDFRQQFQHWITTIWTEKDFLLDSLQK